MKSDGSNCGDISMYLSVVISSPDNKLCPTDKGAGIPLDKQNEINHGLNWVTLFKHQKIYPQMTQVSFQLTDGLQLICELHGVSL